jgi:hypothetical protein
VKPGGFWMERLPKKANPERVEFNHFRGWEQSRHPFIISSGFASGANNLRYLIPSGFGQRKSAVKIITLFS